MSEGDWVFRPVIVFTIAATSFFSPALNRTLESQPQPAPVSTLEERRRSVSDVVGTSDHQFVARWTEYVITRLSELDRGAFSFTDLQLPSTAAIDRARNVVLDTLKFNTPTPSVVPSEYGSVVFVWHRAGWDVEFEIDEFSATLWAYRRHDAFELSGPLSEHRQQFSKLLDEISVG